MNAIRRTSILTGTTASGKTALALDLARAHGGIEIINADSLLVYRSMSIGTAKPTTAELAEIPHHLIDIHNPDEPFNAGDFAREARAAISRIHASGKRALVVGGSGFYLKALLHGMWGHPATDTAGPASGITQAPSIRRELETRTNESLHQELQSRDPKAALRIGTNDRYRLIRSLEIIASTGQTPTELEESHPKTPDPSFELWILDRRNEELFPRIHARTEGMLRDGLIDEVREVRRKFPTARALQSVGYAQVIDFLDGIAPQGRKIRPGLEGLQDEIELATRQLVKRQRTWFRGQETGHWFYLEQDLDSFRKAFSEVYP